MLPVHPLVLITGVLLLVFLVAGSFNSGSTHQPLSIDEFIRGVKDDRFARIDIQDSGEILAQDKYLFAVTPVEGADVGSVISSAPESSGLRQVDRGEFLNRLVPQDPIAQLREVLTNQPSTSRFTEIIIGPDFVIGRTAGKQSEDLIWRGVSEAEFRTALQDAKITLPSQTVVSYLRSSVANLGWDSFTARIENGQILAAYVIDGQVLARVKDIQIPTYSLNWDGGIRSFAGTLQSEGVSLAGDDVRITSIIVATVPWGDIISVLTLIGFIVLGFFLFRGVQSSGSSLMRFGQSKARMFWGMRPDTTLKDVAGVDEAKEELNEIVQFLKNPDKFRKLGARIPKGVLMVGPPGTGKTLLARAIAGEAGVPFFHTSGSEFEEMLVGAGASRVRDLFEKAKKASPALIFIDEIDAVARKRGTTIQSSTTEQTLNQILVEMDGFEQNLNVIIIAATNRPDVLDPAILRPGRFDRRVVLDLPDIEGRRQILEIHSKNKPLAADIDLVRVAKRTVGFSGAELENVLNEAAIIAAKHDKKEISYHDIEEAASKVMMGPALKSRKRTDEELKLVAVHEAGHAVVAKYTPGATPVHRVSILARGMAGGVTEFLPEDDNRIVSRKKLLARIVVGLGGRAAEQVVLSDISTGASGDIDSVTNVARNMVQKFGMSERLGLVKYGESNELQYLGYGYGEQRDYSDETAKLIDEEVRALVSTAYKQALDILDQNRDKLDRLTALLLEKEVIESEEFESIFK